MLMLDAPIRAPPFQTEGAFQATMPPMRGRAPRDACIHSALEAHFRRRTVGEKSVAHSSSHIPSAPRDACARERFESWSGNPHVQAAAGDAARVRAKPLLTIGPG